MGLVVLRLAWIGAIDCMLWLVSAISIAFLVRDRLASIVVTVHRLTVAG